MYNRSTSFLKRFKTQKTQRNAIMQWKPCKKTPTNRNDITCRSSSNNKNLQTIQLGQQKHYFFSCLNHPHKKAIFETKPSLTQGYCQDCSIQLVKNNVRMCKISQQSFYFKSMYEAEIQKIQTFYKQIMGIFKEYFQSQIQKIKLLFIKAKESQQNLVKIPVFQIPKFSQCAFSQKVKQLVGYTHFKKVKFIRKQQKGISCNNQGLDKQCINEGQCVQTMQNKQNINCYNFFCHSSNHKKQKYLILDKE